MKIHRDLFIFLYFINAQVLPETNPVPFNPNNSKIANDVRRLSSTEDVLEKPNSVKLFNENAFYQTSDTQSLLGKKGTNSNVSELTEQEITEILPTVSRTLNKIRYAIGQSPNKFRSALNKYEALKNDLKLTQNLIRKKIYKKIPILNTITKKRRTPPKKLYENVDYSEDTSDELRRPSKKPVMATSTTTHRINSDDYYFDDYDVNATNKEELILHVAKSSTTSTTPAIDDDEYYSDEYDDDNATTKQEELILNYDTSSTTSTTLEPLNNSDYEYYDDDDDSTPNPPRRNLISYIMDFIEARVYSSIEYFIPILRADLAFMITEFMNVGFTGTDMILFVLLAVLNGIFVAVLSGTMMLSITLITRLLTLGNFPPPLGVDLYGLFKNVSESFY